MRPYLIAAALLFAVGGCSASERTEAPAPAPPAAGESAAAGGTTPAGATPAAAATTAAGKAAQGGDAALSSDTEAICDQAAKVSTDFGATFAEDYRLLIEASAKNPQARTEAEQKAARDVRNFSFALVDMSKLAADPRVKKALAAMGAEVTALKGDLDKIDDKKLAGLQAKLDKACDRG